jgi:N-acetylmuramoyl-L-alanine amidase
MHRTRECRHSAGTSLLVLMLLGYVILPTPATARAQKWDRQAAERLLEEARALREEISASPEPVRSRFVRCSSLYRQVYRRDPHFGGSDDAVFEAGLVLQDSWMRFSKPEDLNAAARQYAFLISDYAASRHHAEALLRLADFYAGPLGDAGKASELYATLKSRYRKSKAAAELAARPPAPAPETVPSEPRTRVADQGKPAPRPPEPEPPSPRPALVESRSEPAAAAPVSPAPAGRAAVTNLRHWSTDDYTRVVIDMDAEASFRKTLITNPDRLYFDISRAWLPRDLMNRTFPVGDEFLKQVRIGQNSQDVVRVVLDFEHIADHSVFELHDPYRLVVDIHGTRPTRTPTVARSKGNPRPDELSAAPALTAPLRPPAAPQPKGPPAAGKTATAEGTSKRAEPPASGEAVKSASKPKGDNREAVRTPPPQPVAPTETAAMPPAPPRSAPVPPKPAPPETAGAAGKTEIPAPQPPGGSERLAVSGSGSTKAPPVLPPEKLPAPPITPPRGSRTLTRMLGLKIGRIVLDPGHGGHDTGTIGKGGLLEKDLVLGVAQQLRMQLEESLGAEVIMTREDDRFIPLEERTAIANQARADLFVSIHANSSSSRSTSGVETYFLDFAKSERDRAVAARENASSVRNVSDLEDMIKKIIQADKSMESREFASTVQKRLFSSLQQLFPAARNRGVRSAPFVVLIGANMPSILAEVAFISNPRDEKVLFNDNSKERLAKALSAGIEDYVKLIGVEVANNRGQ